MRINTNVSSLVAQESATNTGKAIASSLEKLSSGLRINKASDDSSGLAIADKLRTQATSLGQGISNGNSAIALLQIADKSMGEQSNILDTIKSKLVQANTDTTSDAGRESIRKDIKKLLTQLDNIASQTNYNGKSLLADVKDGKLTGKEASSLNFQIGASNSDIISTASINSTTKGLGSKTGSIASSIEAAGTSTLNNVSEGTLKLTATSGKTLDLTVNGNLGNLSAGTGHVLTLVVDPNDSELISTLKSIAANDAGAEFVQATGADKTNVFTLTGNAATASASVDLSKVNFSNLKIFGGTADDYLTSDSSSFSVTNNNLQKSVDVSIIQDVSQGKTSTVTSTDTQKDLTVQSTGTNLDINISGNLGSFTVSAADIYITTTNDADTAALQKLIDDGNTNVTRTSGTQFKFANTNTYDLSSFSLSNAKMTGTVGADANIFKTTSSSAVSITNNDTSKLKLDNIDATGGASLEGLKNLGEGKLTQPEASKYQSIVDDAITQLNSFRGDIGSTQNQVESAVKNLQTQQTNIKAAESIIRDVDYASESANFNKQNIISQAGSYAMSQANAVQQNVLRLLQ